MPLPYRPDDPPRRLRPSGRRWWRHANAAKRKLASGREVGVANRVVALRGLHSALDLLVHRAEEPRVDGGVGVDDDDGVERFPAGDQPIEQPVQRRALAGLVRRRPFVHGPAAPANDTRGVVGAVVRDDVHREQLGRIVERVERFQRAADARRLVVRGHEDRESRRGCAGFVCLVSAPSREQSRDADHGEVRARQCRDSSRGCDEGGSCRPKRARGSGRAHALTGAVDGPCRLPSPRCRGDGSLTPGPKVRRSGGGARRRRRPSRARSRSA